MEKPINILFLVQYGKVGGGVNKTLTSQLSKMDRTRFNIYVLATEEGPIVDELRPLINGIKVISVPKSILYRRRDEININLILALFDFLKLIPFFIKGFIFIRQAKIDVIHCNNLKTNFFGIILSKISRVPVICHIRSATSLGIMGNFYEWERLQLYQYLHGAQILSFDDLRETSKHKVIYNRQRPR